MARASAASTPCRARRVMQQQWQAVGVVFPSTPHRCPPRPVVGPARPSTRAQQPDKEEVAEAVRPTVPAAPPAPTPNAPPPPTPEERAAAAWPPARSSLAVAVDKLGSTVDDVLLIARRTLAPGKGPRIVSEKGGGTAATATTTTLRATRPVVLVLGAGWAAHALIKVIDTSRYDVINVSPRNHFLFTPLLPSAAVGSVEFRSITEPIRSANPVVTYCEAEVTALDLEAKVATCTAITSAGGAPPRSLTIPYDCVVVAVGEKTASFGVPGVEEHAVFLKEIADARKLRLRIGELFELAALPGTTREEAARLLSFVVVGGGPTGVEFAGTLADFLRSDLRSKFPSLVREAVSVTLLQSGQSVLTVFSDTLQARALETLRREGIAVTLGVRVTGVHADRVDYRDSDGASHSIPAGLTLWSAGNSSRPLVRDLVQARPELAAYAPNPVTAKLAVDPWCRILGARDALAVGDAAAMVGRRLPPTAQVAGQQGAYVARLLNRGYRIGRGGFEGRPPRPPAVASVGATWEAALASMEDGPGPDREAAILAASDMAVEGCRPGTPAGRVVAAALAGRGAGAGGAGAHAQATTSTSTPPPPKPFEFLSLGLLAYIGSDSGVSELSIPGFQTPVKVSGFLAYALWLSTYLVKQVSTRTRVLVLLDVLKTRVFGRDTSLF